MWKTVSFFFFFSSRRRHTRSLCDLEFRRVLFRSSDIHDKCHPQNFGACPLDGRGLELGNCQRDPWPKTTTAGRKPPGTRPERRLFAVPPIPYRSEERRVGKECRSRWWPYD